MDSKVLADLIENGLFRRIPTLRLPLFWLSVFLTLFAQALPAVAAGSGQRAGASPCGPQSVWTLPRDAFSACLAESPDASLCLIRTMEQRGVPPQVLSCAKALEGDAFLSNFRPMGRVSLATAEYPMRANSNRVPILVGGDPPLVSSELTDAPDVSRDPAYTALKKRYPNLTFWPGDAEFRAMERLPDGGQGFVFAYPLRNGCHACGIAGYALVSLDFDAHGHYAMKRLIRLEPTD